MILVWLPLIRPKLCFVHLPPKGKAVNIAFLKRLKPSALEEQTRRSIAKFMQYCEVYNARAISIGADVSSLIGIQNPVQMIEFVADGAGEKALCF